MNRLVSNLVIVLLVAFITAMMGWALYTSSLQSDRKTVEFRNDCLAKSGTVIETQGRSQLRCEYR